MPDLTMALKGLGFHYSAVGSWWMHVAVHWGVVQSICLCELSLDGQSLKASVVSQITPPALGFAHCL